MSTSKKKVLVVVVMAFVLVIVVLLASRFKKETVINNNLSIIEPNQEAIETKDSDNDGLADWEEALWGTDPQNPDTDSDGTPDGDEVKEGRDPLKIGPDDIFGEAEEILAPELNPTQKLSREFFAEYLTLKKTGEYNEQTAAELVAKLTQKGSEALSIKEYTLSDLKVVPANTANIKKFANEFVTMFANNAHQSQENEFEIFVEWLESQNKTTLAKIDPILESYQGMAAEAPDIAVPTEFANAYLALVNSFVRLETIVGAMRNADIDLISALPALGNYESSALAMVGNTQDIVWMIQDSGAQFTPADPAYPLTQIN